MSQPLPQFQTHSDEEYADLAESDRQRRIMRATEAAIRHGHREAGKRRTMDRRFKRRQKRDEREAE